ncbi:hypothetical protein QJ850_gp262 [Acanthamoeba polyphaga mimivirus]|uniref:Ankyrin repeat protein n=1 Tax=Acanthamoeba polyphaga mimivirus Kroon TaxID=3069720 RepID=A0A0G2Y9A6_9VIRU|nr:hypothetical protein QJ850_gp262 [Acanthamoeba polyphaga mimivirus]AKI80437.1 hypothetical protein [Acanthamoeba polyphaga mimivirus Kroon]
MELNDDYLLYCVGSCIRGEIESKLSKPKGVCRMKLDKGKKITVEYVPEDNYICIDLENAILFIKFISKHNYFCYEIDGDYHKCKMDKYMHRYIMFVINNIMEDHIEIIFSRLLPVYKNFQGKFTANFIELIISGIDKYVSEQLVKTIMDNYPYNDYSLLFDKVIERSTDKDLIEYTIDAYRKKLFRCIKKNKKILPKTNLKEILFQFIINNDVDMFNFVVNSFMDISNDFQELKINDKQQKKINDLKKSFDYEYYSDSLISAAIENNSYKIISQLIDDSIGLDYFDYHSVRYIMKEEKFEVFDVILEKIIKNNKKMINRLFLKSYWYEIPIVDSLISYGANYNKYGHTVIFLAKIHDNKEVADFLKKIINGQ